VDLIAIARLLRTRGNKGELASESLSPDPGRARDVFVGGVGYQVENFWLHQGEAIFKFVGVDSISAAEKLAGEFVQIPREQRLELPDGEFYQSDLIGASVADSAGRNLGIVEGWQEYGGPPLLEIQRPDGRELLVPFTPAICKTVDIAAKQIVVELPEGLEDLNG
jgi:16S rRNA processing protein RimM